MGLITKEVEIKVNGTSSYYEKLGYDVPKHKVKISKEHPNGYAFTLGEKFTVKIEDLPKYSIGKVKVICDCCGKTKEIEYGKYMQSKSAKENKYYCGNCVSKVYLYGKHNKRYSSFKEGRFNLEYRMMKRNVLSRDNYKCVCCRKDYKLEVHHLNGYDKFEDERYDVNNAVTLCKNCHDNFHARYGKGNNTREQFEEWFGSVKDIVSKESVNLNRAREIYCFETDKIYDGTSDVILKFRPLISKTDKKEILDMCNLKNNTFSVKGYHFLWKDIAEKLTKDEIEQYILNNFNNPRRPFVLDLSTYFIFYSGMDRDKYFKIPLKRTNYYTARYNTFEKIMNHDKQCVIYNTFLNFTKEQQETLLNGNTPRLYNKLIS